jgi:hypothetical protein
VKAWKRETARGGGRGWSLWEGGADRSRMTMRVSRDGGRTYGPVIVISPRKDVLPQNGSTRLPDCACPRCGLP